MQEHIPLAIRQSTEILEKARSLAERLKEMAYSSPADQHLSVDPFVFALTIFILACFVGYYVVWKVTPALHTPLMSITNAISGIIVLAALMASSAETFDFSSALGFIAVFFASINIFGGFIVTERMLKMFKNKK